MDVLMLGIKSFLGFLGALIVVFLRLTGALPKPWFTLEPQLNEEYIKEIDKRIKELEDASKTRDQKIEECRQILDIKAPSSDIQIREFEAILQSYKMQMENDSKELESLRVRRTGIEQENSSSSWRNWTLASVLYVVIGAALAAFLAPTAASQNGELVLTDVWQVVVWGGGWVAFVSLADFAKLDAKKKEKWVEQAQKAEEVAGNATQEKDKISSENENLKALIEKYQTVLKQLTE